MAVPQFDPASAVPLETLRRSGLDAYARFHEVVSDREALYRWVGQAVAQEDEEPIRATVATLPPAVDSLPLWTVAALAGHAVRGDLQQLSTLGQDGELATDESEQASGPLRAWYADHHWQLAYLLLEPALDQQPWRSWEPVTEPGGRVDEEQLEHRVGIVTHETGSDWWAAAAFVLLRDWYLDLTPLLTALSLSPDAAVISARAWLDEPQAQSVVPPGSKVARRPPSRLGDLRSRADAAVERFGTQLAQPVPVLHPDSAWGLLLAFAEPGLGSPPVLAEGLADEERVLAALRAASTEPAGTQPGYRPAATVTTDHWTTEDTLGYRLYADAIAEFLWHPDTRPPLTIGIKAPWGAGKTSLMRMVRERIDHGANTGAAAPDLVRTDSDCQATNRTALQRTAPDRRGDEAAPRFARVEDDARRRATVWFNPWTYQSGEHLWAGLAQAIIDGVTERMGTMERERFWFELNLRRVDRARVRHRIYGLLLERVLPLALVALALLVAGLVALAVAPDVVARVTGGLSLAGAVAAGVGAVVRARRFLQSRVEGTFDALVRQPDYEGSAGALHAVQQDMRDVLALVATPERPLVVFVDDLDRCSADVVGEVIEALNLFLAGQYPNCVFVLALEPDVVAAHLEAGRADLLEILAEHLPVGSYFGMGWRFLDKMVQLPLRLPAPEERQLDGYIDSVLGGRGDARRIDDAAVRRRADRLRKELTSVDGLRAMAETVEHSEHAGGEPDGAGAGDGRGRRPHLEEETIRAAEIALSERLRDDAPEVRELVRSYAGLLSRNPREVKRFVNLFRFYAFVQVRRELRDLPAPSLAQVGKMAIVAIRWPYLLSIFGLPVVGEGMTTVLDALEQAAEKDDAWSRAVGDAGLREKMRDMIMADGDLRRVLADDPPLAEIVGFL